MLGAAFRKTPFFFLLTLSLTALLPVKAQKAPSYDSQWRRVEVLADSLGLVRTALDSVAGLYTRARREGNTPQIIKALLYQMRLDGSIQDNAGIAHIRLMEAQTDSCPEPGRAILQSLTAGAYLTYLQEHRFQVNNRTNIEGPIPAAGDPETWTADDFHSRIGALYAASLQDPGLLQQTPLEPYDPILIPGDMRAARPTLYDLLANRALTYFSDEGPDAVQASYAFAPDDSAIFAPAAVFVAHTFRSADTTSLVWKALLLYQDLLRFHQKDARPDALIDADLNRLLFARQHAVTDDPEQAYQSALRQIISVYPQQLPVAQAYFLLAQSYHNLGNPNVSGPDSAYRWDLNKALAIYDKIVREFPASRWSDNARNAAFWIRQPQMTLETETVNLPGQPFRVYVRYSNSDRIGFRLLRADSTLSDAVNNMRSKEFIHPLVIAPAYRSWVQSLPNPGDHQLHGTEIKVDGLPPGAYYLLASGDGQFGKGATPLLALPLHISGISWVAAGNNNYYVLNRETGQPVPGATIRSWFVVNQYYPLIHDLLYPGKTYYSDRNGHFKLDSAETHTGRPLRLSVKSGNDSLALESSYVTTVSRTTAASGAYPPRPRLLFFTDRAIYRPGQTVYFKAIGMIRPTGAIRDTLYLPREPMVFYLQNDRGEKKDSLSLLPGDFGSVHGLFHLPENLLTGRFLILVKGADNVARFSVEAYKRPRFDLSFRPLPAAFRLGDTLRVTGSADGYAGHPIEGATVRYTVDRLARFPFDGRVPIGRHVQSERVITQGVTQTAADGSFSIPFTALPDPAVKKSDDPVFDYSITAEVTDISGETHSKTTLVSAGYTSLVLHLELPDGGRASADSLPPLIIRSANLDNTPLATFTRLRIEKLQVPDRMIRERYWQEPDQFIMDRQTYLHLFPHDDYQQDADINHWPVARLILEDTFTTRRPAAGVPGDRRQAGYSLSDTHLETGVYRITVTASDSGGQTVRTSDILQVYDPGNGRMPYPAYEWGESLQHRMTRGDPTRFLVGSGADSLYLLTQIHRQGHLSVSHRDLTPSGRLVPLSFNVPKADRSGLTTGYAFVRDNRFFSHTFIVAPAPDPHKLEIQYTTFRDRLEPGTPERWSLSIRGPGKAAADAEVLASMYDASLDQFAAGRWALPGTTGVSEAIRWQPAGFGNVPSQEGPWGATMMVPSLYKNGYKQYDQFLFSDQVLFSDNERYNISGGLKRLPGVQVDRNWNVTTQGQTITNITVGGKRFFSTQQSVEDDLSLHVIQMMPLQDGPAGFPFESPPVLRKNLDETAFFYPDLRTDSAGNVHFDFSAPEALTRWRLQTFAHSRDLAFGLNEQDVVTQKTLMLEPDLPRFLRAGDRAGLSIKVVSLDTAALSGEVSLEWLDATTMRPVDRTFDPLSGPQAFRIAPGSSTVVHFTLRIPDGFNNPLVYRLTATAGNFSDGEEGSIPVLPRKILVTESLPLYLNGDTSRQFRLISLLQAKPDAVPYRLSLEYSSNPAWYAIQALPTLLERSEESSDYTFNRYYADRLGSAILHSSPAIARVMVEWGKDTTGPLKSPLETDAGLKSVLLEETPWVMDARGEEAQKQRLAGLMDTNRLYTEQTTALRELQAKQNPSGAFGWFKGGRDDRYITQYIVTGIGHLRQLQLLSAPDYHDLEPILRKAVAYLDYCAQNDYSVHLRDQTSLQDQPQDQDPFPGLTPQDIQYLYARSYFHDYPLPDSGRKVLAFYQDLARKQWPRYNPYQQGMMALALFRSGDTATAHRILASLEETSLNDPQTGRYWKSNTGGWYWYQSPVATQALLIEAFAKIGAAARRKIAGELRTWLLAQKETQAWPGAASTADACYALLLQGDDWLASTPAVIVRLGDTTVDSRVQHTTAGTGYFNRQWDGPLIRSAMGDIRVTPVRNGSASGASVLPNSKPPVSWGGIYYQYFQDMDSITAASGGLSLQKQLFVVSGTDRGQAMRPVNAGDTLHVGEKVRVRLVLAGERDLDYVHLKDLRAACMEPVSVLSGYHWQGDLSYYQSTLDLSTNWYFSRLSKGTHVLEYDLYVSQAGVFSGGMATLECLYAPQFTAHSEGVTVKSQ
jgi:hypothetical protein